MSLGMALPAVEFVGAVSSLRCAAYCWLTLYCLYASAANYSHQLLRKEPALTPTGGP